MKCREYFRQSRVTSAASLLHGVVGVDHDVVDEEANALAEASYQMDDDEAHPLPMQVWTKPVIGIEVLELCMPIKLLQDNPDSMRPRSYNSEDLKHVYERNIFFYDVLCYTALMAGRCSRRFDKAEYPGVVVLFIQHKDRHGDCAAISIRVIYQCAEVLLPSRTLARKLRQNNPSNLLHAEENSTRSFSANKKNKGQPLRPLDKCDVGAYRRLAVLQSGQNMPPDDEHTNLAKSENMLNITNVLSPLRAREIALNAVGEGGEMPKVDVEVTPIILSSDSTVVAEPQYSWIKGANEGDAYDKTLLQLLGGVKKTSKGQEMEVHENDLFNESGDNGYYEVKHCFNNGTVYHRADPAIMTSVETLCAAKLPFDTSRRAAKFRDTRHKFRIVRTMIDLAKTTQGGIEAVIEKTRATIRAGKNPEHDIMHGERGMVASLYETRPDLETEEMPAPSPHPNGRIHNGAQMEVLRHAREVEEQSIDAPQRMEYAIVEISKHMKAIRDPQTELVFRKMYPQCECDPDECPGGDECNTSYDQQVALVKDAYTAKLQGLFNIATGPISMAHQQLIRESEERNNQQFFYRSEHAYNHNLDHFGNHITSTVRDAEEAFGFAGGAGLFVHTSLGTMSRFDRDETHYYHVLFVGKAGLGKSHMIKMIANVENGHLYTYKTNKSDAAGGTDEYENLRCNDDTDNFICIEEMDREHLAKDGKNVNIFKSVLTSKETISQRLVKSLEHGSFVKETSLNESRSCYLTATNLERSEIANAIIDRFETVEMVPNEEQVNEVNRALRSCNRTDERNAKVERYKKKRSRNRYIRCIMGILQQASIMPYPDKTLAEQFLEIMKKSNNNSFTGFSKLRTTGRIMMLATEAMYDEVIARAFDVEEGSKLPDPTTPFGRVDFENVARLSPQLIVTVEHITYAVTCLENSVTNPAANLVMNELQKLFRFQEYLAKNKQPNLTDTLKVPFPQEVEGATYELDPHRDSRQSPVEKAIAQLSSYVHGRLKSKVSSEHNVREYITRLFRIDESSELDKPGYVEKNAGSSSSSSSRPSTQVRAIQPVTDVSSRDGRITDLMLKVAFFKRNFTQADSMFEEVINALAHTWEGASKGIDIVTGRPVADSLCLLQTINAEAVLARRRALLAKSGEKTQITNVEGAFVTMNENNEQEKVEEMPVEVDSMTQFVWNNWMTVTRCEPPASSINRIQEEEEQLQAMMADLSHDSADGLPNITSVSGWMGMLQDPHTYISLKHRNRLGATHYPEDLGHLTHDGRRQRAVNNNKRQRTKGGFAMSSKITSAMVDGKRARRRRR